MDPVNPPGPPGATPVFQGAEADAQILRARLNDLFSLAPEGSVLQDPQRRAKLAKSAENVVELTAELGALQLTVPGRAGRILGPVLTGLEKQPGTGKVAPTPGTAGNFAPSPFGFLEPTAIGLTRNFYLPAGATNFVPRGVDIVGFGLPEQRREDETRNSQLQFNTVSSTLATAQAAVQGESESTLQDLAAGRGGFTRAGVIIATSGLDLPTLRNAAQVELNQRSAGTSANQVVTVPAIAGALLVASEAIAAPAVSAPTQPAGGPDAARLRPVNDAGKRHEQTAQGIARELIHERADP